MMSSHHDRPPVSHRSGHTLAHCITLLSQITLSEAGDPGRAPQDPMLTTKAY